jgi:hypothetical protein
MIGIEESDVAAKGVEKTAVDDSNGVVSLGRSFARRAGARQHLIGISPR